MNTTLNKAIVVSFLTFLMISCVKEPIGNCPSSSIYLSYYYTLNKESVNKFENEINHLMLYVFDSSGLYYDNYEVTDKAQLTNDNSIKLDLPPALWKIVAVGGDLESFDISDGGQGKQVSISKAASTLQRGVSTLSDFRLGLKVTDDPNDADTLFSELSKTLYYGQYVEIESQRGVDVSRRVSVTNNVKNIVVKIGGVSYLSSAVQVRGVEQDFKVSTSLSNSTLGYDNEVHSTSKQIRYVQPTVSQGDTVRCDMRVLRLHQTNASGVVTVESPHITGGGVTIPLVSTIMSNPQYKTQEDLDREDTFEFVVTVNSDFETTISVNGWVVVNIEGEI